MKRKILKMIGLSGCKLIDDGSAIELLAPDGYVFLLTDSCSTQRFNYSDGSWKKSDIWEELYEYLINGIGSI